MEDPYNTENSRDEGNTKQQNDSIAVKIFTVIILILMVCTFAFAFIEPKMAIMFMGMVFFVAGIMIFAANEKKVTAENCPALIFPFVGSAITIMSGIVIFFPQYTDKVLDTVPLIAGIFMTVIGIALIILPQYFYKKKAEVCNVTVDAVCTHLNKKRGDKGSTLYAPVWEYVYNDRAYKYAENVYSNINVPSEGDVLTLNIDPNNPSDAYRSDKSLGIILGITGVVFIIFGVLLIVLFKGANL